MHIPPEIENSDREPAGVVHEAARWLAVTPRHARGDRPVVRLLGDTFGLNAIEACEACRLSAEIGRRGT